MPMMMDMMVAAMSVLCSHNPSLAFSRELVLYPTNLRCVNGSELKRLSSLSIDSVLY